MILDTHVNSKEGDGFDIKKDKGTLLNVNVNVSANNIESKEDSIASPKELMEEPGTATAKIEN